MDIEFDVLERAGEAFARQEKIKKEMQAIDGEIRKLCTEYSQHMRMWGYTPNMLRLAVEARLGRRNYG